MAPVSRLSRLTTKISYVIFNECKLAVHICFINIFRSSRSNIKTILFFGVVCLFVCLCFASVMRKVIANFALNVLRVNVYDNQSAVFELWMLHFQRISVQIIYELISIFCIQFVIG